MSFEPNGELVPVGGGDAIPLIRELLTIGRRPSCDVCLEFPNISGKHCELAFFDGCWILRDLNSTNGVKVNGNRVAKKVLHPGDVITIAKRHYTINYAISMGRQALAEILEESEEFNDTPLLEKAGLAKSQESIDRAFPGESVDRPRAHRLGRKPKSVDKPRSIDKPKSIDKPRSIDQPLPRPNISSTDDDEEDDD
jgi:pSer/pThr/pTyr-binding forkhead associated (FHA) protein